MIEKEFKNVQSMHQLIYSILCGYSFEVFTAGKGVYGHRVSTCRSKDPKKLFTAETDFKNSEFLTIEGIKAMEFATTIINTRQRMEAFFTSKECMYDFLSTFNKSYVDPKDIENSVENWYQNVSKKLLGNNILDFAKLNNFMLGSIVLYMPIDAQEKIAQFRQEQILTYLTQDIISPDFAKMQLDLLPNNREKLILLKQKLILQRKEKLEQKQALQKIQITKQVKNNVKEQAELLAEEKDGTVCYKPNGQINILMQNGEYITKIHRNIQNKGAIKANEEHMDEDASFKL